MCVEGGGVVVVLEAALHRGSVAKGGQPPPLEALELA